MSRLVLAIERAEVALPKWWRLVCRQKVQRRVPREPRSKVITSNLPRLRLDDLTDISVSENTFLWNMLKFIFCGRSYKTVKAHRSLRQMWHRHVCMDATWKNIWKCFNLNWYRFYKLLIVEGPTSPDHFNLMVNSPTAEWYCIYWYFDTILIDGMLNWCIQDRNPVEIYMHFKYHFYIWMWAIVVGLSLYNFVILHTKWKPIFSYHQYFV